MYEIHTLVTNSAKFQLLAFLPINIRSLSVKNFVNTELCNFIIMHSLSHISHENVISCSKSVHIMAHFLIFAHYVIFSNTNHVNNLFIIFIFKKIHMQFINQKFVL